jgi:cell division topological specificity factor
MFENIVKFFKGLGKNNKEVNSKDAAKERLHLVLMQDRANISADFLALMKQEIIEVIKKYIDVDENAIDVRLTNKSNDDGTTGAPVLYANIPIMSVKEEAKEEARKVKAENKVASSEDVKEEEEVKKEEKANNNEVEKEKEKEEQEKETNEVIEKAEEIVEEIKAEEDSEVDKK